MQPENISDMESLLPTIQRTMASAERGFYKSLTTLRQLQRTVASFRKKPHTRPQKLGSSRKTTKNR